MSDFLTVLRHPMNLLTKTWLPDGTIKAYDDAKYFTLKTVEIDGIQALSRLLKKLETDPKSCVIRGRYMGDEAARELDPEWKDGRVRKIAAVYDDVPHHWALIEIDNFEPLTTDPVDDPVGAVDEYVATMLPSPFHGVSYHWQLSSSAGHQKNAGKLKAHVWFWLDTPYTSEQLRAWVEVNGIEVDKSVFQTVQIHYTAAPLFEGVADPVPVRSGFAQGYVGDTVDLMIPADILAAAAIAKNKLSRQQRVLSAAETDPIAQLLYEKGMVKSLGKDGQLFIDCPRKEHHTGDSGPTSTAYYPPHTGGYAKGNFACRHAHCQNVAQRLFHEALGYDDVLSEFEVLGSPPPAAGGVEGGDVPPIRERSIPDAKHLTTDQANAVRIVRRYKSKLISVGGRWYAWIGTHWAQDEGEVYNHAMTLSRIIHKEADNYENQAVKSDEDREANAKIAKSLREWAKKSESRAAMENALYLARKVLEVPADVVNRNPWLLNCLNGTVDLRTGKLQEHNPEDYITKLAPYNYNPQAACELFEKTIACVTLENAHKTRPLADFLRRWFGYCATASTREQKFVVHYGNGRNGKSTIIDLVTDVLGDYAGTAAPGLLVAQTGGERHPTELADLFSKRMVTAHEGKEGGILREDFVKQATGSDRIKARYMRADFFEFNPTHKIQLLTNYKPVIKGQDEGIWRRVLLVPYCARFGSTEEVVAGTATHLRDTSIAERLAAEKEGVLAWVVAGAVEWYRDGLNPPDIVLAASKDYQAEQDRVKQFCAECCEMGREFTEVVNIGDYEGIFPAYKQWCKESGFMPLSRMRFVQELGRLVPYFEEFGHKETPPGGKRRTVLRVRGVKLANG